MTKTLPTLFGLSIENIKQKVTLFRSIGLYTLAVEDTSRLMQSSKKTYARYKFLSLEKGIRITLDDYTKLFISEKKFEQQFGVTSDDLYQKYDYEEFLEENGFGGK